MRIFLMMFVAMFLMTGWARATVVNLTDGRSVQGTILKQDDKSLQVSVDGVTMTYYADEVKDIDGKPFGAAQPAAQPAASPVPVEAPAVDADKKALIVKFIDVFGTRQALSNNFELMLKQIAKEKPDEAQKIRDRVKVDEIIDRLIPIYDRNFTADDLKAFIDFYQSPSGHKLIATIPVLMKESVQESIKYMEEKFPEAQTAKQ
jgi:Uncharacterized protein conserved in bacteria (DUF2059)